jgi:hypothetical protein
MGNPRATRAPGGTHGGRREADGTQRLPLGPGGSLSQGTSNPARGLYSTCLKSLRRLWAPLGQPLEAQARAAMRFRPTHARASLGCEWSSADLAPVLRLRYQRKRGVAPRQGSCAAYGRATTCCPSLAPILSVGPFFLVAHAPELNRGALPFIGWIDPRSPPRPSSTPFRSGAPSAPAGTVCQSGEKISFVIGRQVMTDWTAIGSTLLLCGWFGFLLLLLYFTDGTVLP